MSLTVDRGWTDHRGASVLLGRDAGSTTPLTAEWTMMIRCLPARVCLWACTAGLVLSACGDNGRSVADAGSLAAPPPVLQIKTLSNRADLVSGGDVLVEVIVPAGSPTGTVHVFAGARDVSAAFTRGSDGRTLGVITGLGAGATQIKADLDGRQAAILSVTNHPIG